MKLLETLLETLPQEPVQVRKVVVGVHWTLVCSKFCGLGSTLVGTGAHGHSAVRDVGELHKKSAQELARWMLSDNLLEASIGIAAFNSLTPRETRGSTRRRGVRGNYENYNGNLESSAVEVDEDQLQEINAAEVIARHSKGKNLVVVGHFPFVERIKPSTKNCWVIEKRPFGDDFPEEAAQEYIPQADVIALTGTAFINHTMEGLLSLCSRDALVMILGPSTPLVPLLFERGVSFLSGARVYDEDAATITIQQGAIFPQVQGVRLVTMAKGV